MTPQQERVLNVLKAHRKPSTIEIGNEARVAGVRDYVRRLRQAGYDIETHDGRENGVRVVRYELHTPKPAPPPGELFLTSVEAMKALEGQRFLIQDGEKG